MISEILQETMANILLDSLYERAILLMSRKEHIPILVHVHVCNQP